jgi:hypothetical protein
MSTTRTWKDTLRTGCKRYETFASLLWFGASTRAILEQMDPWRGWIDNINDRLQVPLDLKLVSADLNRTIGRSPRLREIDHLEDRMIWGDIKTKYFEQVGKWLDVRHTMLLLPMRCLQSREEIQNGSDTLWNLYLRKWSHGIIQQKRSTGLLTCRVRCWGQKDSAPTAKRRRRS